METEFHVIDMARLYYEMINITIWILI